MGKGSEQTFLKIRHKNGQKAQENMLENMTSLIIQEIQIKTTVRYHHTLARVTITETHKQNKITSVDKNVEKRQPLCAARGNATWYGHYGEQCGGSSKIKCRTSR